MRLVRFGTVDLPDKDVESSLPVSARSALIDLPGGAIDQDGNTLNLQSATLSHRALIVDQIDPKVQDLLKQLGRGRLILRAELRDQSAFWVTFAKMTGFKREVSADDYHCKQPIAITWQQDYPYWLLGTDGWFLDSGHFLDSGMVLDGNYQTVVITASPTNFSINNDGTAIIPMGTVTMIPRAASSLVNPKIVNLTNGMGFQWIGVLAAADRLVVDFLTKTVEHNGSSGFNNFAVTGPRQTKWMQLELGSNSLQLTGNVTGTIDCYWQYMRHYL